MALSPQIAALRSSGTYRFEFDKSQTVSIPAEQIRLVVGVSKKGPFNTPVYVPDSGYFQDVFGELDRSLERKGSYFHRTCLAALERGPILALNLLRLNDTVDKTDAKVFSTSCTTLQSDANLNVSFSGYFNRDKFWYPNPESFLNNISSAVGNKIFNLTNIGNRPLSVIVRKADVSTLKGFDITVKEWYGVSNIPDYLHKDDYISDFMIDVIVIGGDFGSNLTTATPYEKIAGDPLFASYFDTKKGIKRKLSPTDKVDTSLNYFLNLPQVQNIATYTGCLIPDFVDLNGTPMFIQDIINAETAKTGLFCAINKDAFDNGNLLSGIDGGIDLIGHNVYYETPKAINFLSYKDTVSTDLTFAKNAVALKTLNITGIIMANGTSGNLIFSVDSTTNPAFYNIVADAAFMANQETPRVVGTYVQTPAGTFAPVVTKQVTSTTALFELSGVTTASFATAGSTVKYANAADLNFVIDDTITAASGTVEAAYSSALFTDAQTGIITDGDTVNVTMAGDTNAADMEKVYLYVSMNTKNSIVYQSGVNSLTGIITDTNYPVPVATLKGYETSDFIAGSETPIRFSMNFWDSTSQIGNINTLIVQTLKGSLNTTIPATATAVVNQITVTATAGATLNTGDYLLSETGGSTGPSRLTRITKIAKDGNNLIITTVGKVAIINIAGSTFVEAFKPITEWVDYYQVATLSGFNIGDYHLPNGTDEQQSLILGDTLSGTNLYKALIDKDMITFRYIVDTFGFGITSSSKAVLSTLAHDRQNALAILNAPSMKNFKDSLDPYFNDLTGALSTRMIADGGDLTKNPKVLYSLPSIPAGSNYCAFYAPYVLVRDRGKNLAVPPAGYISNNFVEKYVSSLPWSIVAGARRGVVSGNGVVGIEYNFSKEDRDYLEPFGINPMIFQSGTGIVIFGNKTAQQNVKSALSSVHVREVLIYIQDGIASILKNFLFEYNTPQTRLEIKTLADNFLVSVKSDGGVYDFRNIMDDTNNTQEVIDKNIAILDTYVEPTKGMEIIVHRTTVLKTGQISTGNFM